MLVEMSSDRVAVCSTSGAGVPAAGGQKLVTDLVILWREINGPRRSLLQLDSVLLAVHDSTEPRPRRWPLRLVLS